MTTAIPQRTVTITIRGTGQADARVNYSYWSPNDSMVRVAASRCDLIEKHATNTLFVLDYASTLDGWTMVRTSPNPEGAPALPFELGPEGTSLLTKYACRKQHNYAFYIHYKNTVTGGTAVFDPQEGNEPGDPD